jgi:translation initiation factor IF-2
LKTDVLGSLEALLGMIEKVSHDLVGVDVIQKGLGNVTEADIQRAMNSRPSVVYGFNVLTPTAMEILAREKEVDVRSYKIIYELFDDIVARLNVLVPPEIIITHLGEFEAVAIFRTEHARMVVGGKVTEGKLLPNEKVRVWRRPAPGAEEEPIGEGLIDSLQSGKSTAKEVHAGQECGISFKGKTKIQVGDRLEVYHEEIKARKFEVPR